jgi:CRISPR-associated protein Cas6/Cse3/CasE subtype I-E
VKDFNLKKPNSISGYPIHRAVAALTNGAPHLWRDNGETLTIRTSAQLDAEGVEVPSVRAGELRMFDHKARQEWLGKQGQRHGFTVVAVHCTGGMTRVADQGRRDFAVDSTDFTGVLKVTDTVAFENALRCGVGNTGRAFGFSLLSI